MVALKRPKEGGLDGGRRRSRNAVVALKRDKDKEDQKIPLPRSRNAVVALKLAIPALLVWYHGEAGTPWWH